MNLSFSLEKASSFSPAPGPAMLVVLEPAAAEEAVADSGAAAASASLRLSVIAAMLRSCKIEKAEQVRRPLPGLENYSKQIFVVKGAFITMSSQQLQ